MNTTIDRLTAALADRYTLDRELGAGGMATVYLAHDIKHDRSVAIKVLRPELSAVIGAERFLAEIKTTANLQHPHILPLFDSGVATPPMSEDRSSNIDHPSSSFLFYVMPFVEGESLRDKLAREHQLDLAESLEITRQVASALAYAHQRGIVHRDIKPENILLSSGHAVVADFGIARAIGAAGGEQLTATGTAIGSPAYMSPEQSAGMSDVDGRSDTYSLAAVLFEMLAGEPPHTGATVAAIIAKRLGTTAPSVRLLRDTVPGTVDRALQCALQRAPADRFSTAGEFAAALQGGAARRSSLLFSRRSGLALVAVLMIVAAGWFGRRNARSAVELDADVIAVLPFRVGGDTAIAYLRESMLDLLQARLSSGVGARTVEPRTLLAAWRRAVDNESDDLSEDASRGVARELGAGRVLLGSAVITPTELTISSTLIRVSDGEVLARESVAGAPDSVALLVNRLTAALLIRDAGEARDREAGLAAAPLDALQDYLAGRKAYRRGDYFRAMDLYGRALGRDSTFVEAAFSMVATNAWIGTVFETSGLRVIPRVWAMRDRLGARDRALFLAIPSVGPNYPNASNYRDIIAQAERATNAAPDNPEPWLLLGQLFTHYGMAASRTDWAPRAAAALDRAIALDSSFTIAVDRRLYLALQAGDSSATRKSAALLEAHVTAGFSDDVMLWAAARAGGDTAEALRRRAGRASLTRTESMQRLTIIALHSAQFALPLDDARWAVAQLTRDAVTDDERGGARLGMVALRFAEGRTVSFDEIHVPAYGYGWAAGIIERGVFEAGYRELASRAMKAEAAGSYRITTAAGAISWVRLHDCFGELFRITGGDTAGTAQVITRLWAFDSGGRALAEVVPGQMLALSVCPMLLDALLEAARPADALRPALDRLDALMQGGPLASSRGGVLPTAFANYTISRLREAQGDYRAALAAIRRRSADYYPQYLWSLTPFLRQEGRVAALAGDTAGALRAYDQYLTLRTNPDPPFRSQRDSVIAERKALRP